MHIHTYIHTYSAIEEMAGMDLLCSDKTGTLTLNKMVIQDDCPVYTEVCIYVCIYAYIYIYVCMCTYKQTMI